MTTKKLGQNRGYIEELYASYLADPASVSEAWRDYFADYPGERSERPAPTPVRAPAAPPAGAVELRGAAARLAENMERSLGVPTATSARTIAVKLLDENRRRINQHQSIVAGPKISFTHLVAWAVVRALERHPALNGAWTRVAGRPARASREGVNLGLAVDHERRGERALVVPNVKRASELDFPAFVRALDDIVLRVRENRLSPEDVQDTTITLTNPGMIGTALSVPRLMEGQGAIIGVGAIGYPPEYSGMAAQALAELGLSKVMTVTSTYDHRIIQGAESGAFLSTLDELLQGQDGFYERLFGELGVPCEPVHASTDPSPPLLARGTDIEAIAKQAGVLQLIRAFRVRGHLWADLDPLGYRPEPHPELELSHYGLGVWDLDRKFVAGGLAGITGPLELREILRIVHETYCRHLGVEYMHIEDPGCRRWLQERLERLEGPAPPPHADQLRILEQLNAADAFETYLARNYVGQKRFSLEGAETLIPMLDFLLADAADAGIEQVVVGMAHRGRLNVLANTVGKSAGQVFREFEGDIDPTTTHGSGDVKYHLGAAGDFRAPSGKELRVEVASNPSHLEAVDPVVEGLVRARQDGLGNAGRDRVLALLIHGDAAFAGQGVVAETLHLSQLKGYRTGGTVHIVVNNQIGFTTGPADLRSSHYPTDVAKMVRAPIFHVNGDHPESAVAAIRTALAYRQAFKRDVVVDLVCYRRWGHNEADDPSFTHPMLYARIQSHRPVRKIYTDQLLRRGDIDLETAERALEDYGRRLREVHDQVRRAQREPAPPPRGDEEKERGAAPLPATDLPRATLVRVLTGLARTPDDFVTHPKLAASLSRREQRFEEGRIDWALAESLAFGSLVLEGTPVRLSGEDSGRGTFSQRHAVLHDHRTALPFVPLAHLDPAQASFQVFDSLLSEFAVLGFEYGYSVGDPRALVLWEAQFGDFANGAQVIIDQFIASAEEKWNQPSRLVLLLPHGHEGQGPEHSSARIERFLQLAAGGNIRVTNPSTPAQYFHLLRAQARLAPRGKPLVVMTPKSLLRHRACVSTPDELCQGAFRPVLDDPTSPAAEGVDRIVFCSGKIYWELDEARAAAPLRDVALCRLEQLYPFPAAEIAALVARYPRRAAIVWVQEEPRNMGAWSFVRERLEDVEQLAGRLRYVGRPRSPSPATGSHRRHLAEQEAIIREALAVVTVAR
jgi:2-oxoglutarate dehydrogenase E1 component